MNKRIAITISLDDYLHVIEHFGANKPGRPVVAVYEVLAYSHDDVEAAALADDDGEKESNHRQMCSDCGRPHLWFGTVEEFPPCEQ